MKIVLAPDSYKNSLTAKQVAQSMKKGFALRRSISRETRFMPKRPKAEKTILRRSSYSAFCSAPARR